jgi:glutamine cyclotransferase
LPRPFLLGHCRFSLAALAIGAMLALAALMIAEAPDKVPICGYEVVRQYPHDETAFTQGLFFHRGHLYEGTGQYGQSRIRRIELASGRVLAESRYPSNEFGEGIARWGDQIVSLTWHNGIGRRWRLNDLKPVGTFRLAGEGWGLAAHGNRLVVSDGSASLRFLDPTTMAETGRVAVTLNGRPLDRLNELESIGGEIWANIWMTDMIARIDPGSGRVTGLVDLTGLKERAGAQGTDSVLNGIAWDDKGKRLFVTGKNWPALFHIRTVNCR